MSHSYFRKQLFGSDLKEFYSCKTTYLFTLYGFTYSGGPTVWTNLSTRSVSNISHFLKDRFCCNSYFGVDRLKWEYY